MDESSVSKELATVFRIIEEDKDQMLSWLKELVAIPTISAEKEHRKDILRLIHQTQEKLKKHGVHVILEPLGDQKLSDGSQVPFPPLLLASTNHDPKRKTLLVYGHLDVQPAHKDDGWETEPFQPVEKDGRLYGRGTAHNKGPLTACIWALCAFLQSAGRPPLNVRLLIDNMQEVDSQGMAAYLKSDKRSEYLKAVDYVCISDGVWLGPRTPCLTYALRGICHFQVEVTCARVDLHSGIYGGTAIEAMPDLMYLLNSLTDAGGRITIPGIYNDVQPVTHEERKIYEGFEFDIVRCPQSNY
ncbi:hypothetical protein V5799_019850 [Amblyomma americanum]|uniref:Peptidase M20 dimerisation domain-containing protein n=1 Tax=Amblyomma americanum TaxID=6943 RepID=A0AAQ4EVZ0_AMBAM